MANLEFNINVNASQAASQLEMFMEQLQKLQAMASQPIRIQIGEISRSVQRAVQEGIRKPPAPSVLTQPATSYSTSREQRIRYYEMREQILGTFMQLYAIRNFARFFEGVGTAIDSFRRSLVEVGTEVGSNLVRVGAVANMTASQLENFANRVGRITTQAFLAPQQAMEVAYLVATRGIQERGALETAIKTIGQFAFMTRSDPSQVARSLLTAFMTVNLGKNMAEMNSLMKSEFPRIANMLYMAYTRSPIEAQMILDALKYIGPAYGVTGRPFTELLASLMAASQVIPQGGLLGRHLRSFLVFLSNPERLTRAMQVIGQPIDAVKMISQIGLPKFLEQLGQLLRGLSPEKQLQFWHTAVGLRAAPLAIVLSKMVDQIASYAQTLANESANALQKAIDRIKMTPFGRLQTLDIEIQETKRQLSGAAMEAEIMLKEMQLRFLRVFSSLPQGLQTSLYVVGKGATMFGKGLNIVSDLMSTFLMWEILKSLGKQPMRLLGRAGLIGGILASALTGMVWILQQGTEFTDNLESALKDAQGTLLKKDLGSYLLSTGALKHFTELPQNWKELIFKFLPTHGGIWEFGAMVKLNYMSKKYNELFEQVDKSAGSMLKKTFEDLQFYHGEDVQKVIDTIRTSPKGKKIVDYMRYVLGSSGFNVSEMSDAFISQFVAMAVVEPTLFKSVFEMLANAYKNAGLEVPQTIKAAIEHSDKLIENIKKIMEEVEKANKHLNDKLKDLEGREIPIETFEPYFRFLSVFKMPAGQSIWANLPSVVLKPKDVGIAPATTSNLDRAAENLHDAARMQWRNTIGFSPDVFTMPNMITEY